MTTTPPEQTPPLVEAAKRAFVEGHAEVTQHAHEARSAWLTEWLEAFESEHAGVIGHVLHEAMQHGDMPQVLRDVLAPMVTPEHQTQVILGLFSIGSIISQFVGAVIAPYVRDAASFSWSHDPTMPLSPAELALGVLKGHIDQTYAESEARKNGLTAEMFLHVLLNTGEPLGLEQLLLLYRRGQIGDAELEHGIRQSRVRDEWIAAAKELRYVPVGAGEVLAGAVQSHLSDEDARKRIAEAGIDPSNYEWLYETHGRPPGPQEMLDLLNRGELTEAQVVQGIRESDIKNKYIPALLALRRYLPPPRTIVAQLRHGALTDDEATRLFLENGLTPDDAAHYVREAHYTRQQVARELAETQVRQLYTARLITQQEALSHLHTLGYDDESAHFLLALADHERHARFQTAAINRVHSQYEAHRIDATQVGTLLDKIGVPSEARDDLLKLWTDERAANVPRLSVSECQGALRRGLMELPEFMHRMEQYGWSEHDALTLARLAWPPTSYDPVAHP